MDGSQPSPPHWEHSSGGKVRWLSSLEPAVTPHDFRKTGLICTIGPTTNSLETIRELRTAGLNIVRLNFSHGDHEFHQSAIKNVREAQRTQPGRPMAIALDTKGPEIRTGMVQYDGGITIRAGQEIILTTDEAYAERCDADHM